MKTTTSTTRRIGSVWVDSGQMMLGDPCYLSGWQDTPAAFDRPGEYSYAGACTATTSDQSAGMLGKGLAAVFSTGYGDGTYPVDVTYNSEGRVVAVTILFEDDAEEDAECGHCGTVVDAEDIYDGLCPECQTIGDHNDEED